jgi:SNF2 family DNA or RNA helicase
LINKKHCPQCNKLINSCSESRIGNLVILRYGCGHYEAVKQLTKASFDNFVSIDGRRPYKFQIDGALFVINAGARALIADEMGIGKTVQTCMVLKAHEKELCKFLVVCKSSIQIQWMRELMRWNGPEWMTQIINSEKEFIFTSAKGYIISYDLLHGSCRVGKNGKMILKGIQDIDGLLEKLQINTLILDEVQHIKNTESKRAQAVRHVSRKTDYIIGLSGTPIKNHAGEYFSILNILHPEKFPSYLSYDRKYLESYWNGYGMKTGGMKNPDIFKRDTESFIIRRTRNEVLPDLPNIQRNYSFCELGDIVEQAYKDTLKQFQDYYNYGSVGQTALEKSSNILAYLSKMRHLTGLAKIQPVVEYLSDFLTETDRKIIIFTHHKDVVSILKEKLEALLQELKLDFPILEIKSEMSIQERNKSVLNFQDDKHRIIICSTLAAGEGIDGLQVASDAIFMERQWNPANEDQAEGRIVRMGQKSSNLVSTYFTAIGTVDEFFAELVEKKRSIVISTLDNKEYKWDQSNLMTELADILASTGGKKWGF